MEHDWKPGSRIDGFFHWIAEPDSPYHGAIAVDADGQVRLELFHHQPAPPEMFGNALETGTTVHGTTRDGGSISLFCKGKPGVAWRSNGFHESSWMVDRFIDGDHVDLSQSIGVRSLDTDCDALVALLNTNGYRSTATEGRRSDPTLSVRFSQAPVHETRICPRTGLTIILVLADRGTIVDRMVEMRRIGHVTWTWDDDHTLVFDGSDPDVQAMATMIASLLNHPVRFAEVRGISPASPDTPLRIVLPHLVGIDAGPPDTWEVTPLTTQLRKAGWNDYARGWWNAWGVARDALTRWHRLMWHDQLPLEWSFFLTMSCFESLLLARHGKAGSGWLVDSKGETLRLAQAMNRFKEKTIYSELLGEMGLLADTYFPGRGTDRVTAFERMRRLRNAIAHGDAVDGDGRIGPFAAHLESTKHLRRLVELMILENMGVEQNHAVEIVSRFIQLPQ